MAYNLEPLFRCFLQELLTKSFVSAIALFLQLDKKQTKK